MICAGHSIKLSCRCGNEANEIMRLLVPCGCQLQHQECPTIIYFVIRTTKIMKSAEFLILQMAKYILFFKSNWETVIPP